MSDVQPDLFNLPRPAPPESWRDRIAGWAETLDITPGRLLVGLAVLVVGGWVAWRMLAPAPLPPEMELPFASTTVATADVAGAGAGAGTATDGSVGDGASAGEAAAMPAGSTESVEVVVHVAGAVVAPGVQRLEAGSRVIDAVDAAGGATGEAELARINLAAPLEDGLQVYIPRFGEVAPPPPVVGGAAEATSGASAATSSATGSTGGLVDVNRATTAELEELPGIGPAIAQAIIDHREQQGPFATVEQLLDVRGIGEAKLEDLRDLVTV